MRVSLDKFTEKYVLCENCKLAEIDMYVKNGIIQGRCNACGWAGELDNVDKPAAFIIKNPPATKRLSEEREEQEKKEKKDKEKKEKKDKK